MPTGAGYSQGVTHGNPHLYPGGYRLCTPAGSPLPLPFPMLGHQLAVCLAWPKRVLVVVMQDFIALMIGVILIQASKARSLFDHLVIVPSRLIRIGRRVQNVGNRREGERRELEAMCGRLLEHQLEAHPCPGSPFCYSTVSDSPPLAYYLLFLIYHHCCPTVCMCVMASHSVSFLNALKECLHFLL